MDLYEAAAYLRMDYHTMRNACVCDRAGHARLSHQRIGSAYRIRRTALDRFGLVEEPAQPPAPMFAGKQDRRRRYAA